MANLYFRTAGSGVWNVASNWSLTDGGTGDGAVPTSADAVFFTALSRDCNMGVAGSVLTIDFTGYTGTLTITTFAISVYGTTLTLSPTMTIVATTGGFTMRATSSIRSNGKAIPNLTNITGAATFTLLDNLTITGNLTTVTSGTKTFNGFTMYIGGNLTLAVAIAGTTNIVLNGTGTWSGNFSIANNLSIDTLGTLTVSGTVNADNLTYVKGTLVTTGSILSYAAISGTYDLRGSTWGTIYCGIGTGNSTINFTSGFVCSNLILNPNISLSSVIVNFTPGFTYRATTSFVCTITSSDTLAGKTFRSSVAGTRATLTLDAGAVCTVEYTTFTDIDASNGRTIWVFGRAAITNSLNINTYGDPISTTAKSFVS